MTFEELRPELDKLSRADKFRAVQALLQQLADGEGDAPAVNAYQGWSPVDAFGAADELLAMLAHAKKGVINNG